MCKLASRGAGDLWLPQLLRSLCLLLSLLSNPMLARPAAAQDDAPLTPPPLFSDREDQVEQFLANAPPGADEGGKPGLRVSTANRFEPGSQVAVMLACCACLGLLAPGLFLFYASLRRESFTAEVVGRVVGMLCFLSLAWVLFIYSIAFSRNAHSYDVLAKEIQVMDRESAPGSIFIGDSAHWGLQGLSSNWGGGNLQHPLRRQGDRIPHVAFMTFQMMIFLQALVPLLVITDRRFSRWSLIPFWLLWSTFVYAPLSFWIQGGGWLADCIDAGSAVAIHVSLGFTALGLYLAGRNRGAAPAATVSAMGPTVGALLFFIGSLLVATCRGAVSQSMSAVDLLNMFLAGSSGLLLWLALELRQPQAEWTRWPLGLISGVVAITAGSACMAPGGAILTGLVGAIACYATLNAGAGRGNDLRWLLFSVQGVSGVAGLLMAGVFASAETAGADVRGLPIVGLISGNVEQLRVQFVTAAIGAATALIGGLILPQTAQAIGAILSKLFGEPKLTKPSPESSVVS